ncbi:MAG: HNH endonuclease [Acidimicrobiia bacterium]|nr:HNH endonuclease [Acidimicrobiia bacterium]
MFDVQNPDCLLDNLEPGPVLAGLLHAIDVEQVAGHDRVAVLRAHQRMASYYAAQVYEDMAAVSDAMHDLDDDPVLAVESAAAEIRAALRLTRRAADSELSMALSLRRRLPRVWALLASGDIDVRRARVVIQTTSHLTLAAAREVAEEVLEAAPRLTTGQLGARLRRLCLEAVPDEATDRYREAVADRRLIMEPTEAGTADLLGLDLPPERVAAIAGRINEIARSLRSATESRTMDQVRADVFLDLLDGSPAPPGSRPSRGSVDIQVDLKTLTGLDDHAGELAGYGPVIADIARQVAEQQPHAEWRFTVTDPNTGSVIHTGITRRRPTVGQRRAVEARNPTCIFPGCRMPAADSDLDHRTPYGEGGPTDPSNLAPLCRHDHRIRHRAGWTYQPLEDGDHMWTTKLGHSYITSGASP